MRTALLLRSFACVAMAVPIGSCREVQPPKSLVVVLGAQPTATILPCINKKGEYAAISGEFHVAIGGVPDCYLKTVSYATFIDIDNSMVTRVVCTPMQNTGDLADALNSLQFVVEYLPEDEKKKTEIRKAEILSDFSHSPAEVANCTIVFDLSD